MQTKEQKIAWVAANKAKVLAYAKAYYHKNKEVILTKNRQRCKRYWRVYSKTRYADRREKIDQLKMQMGCQNPDCNWKGSFLPCDLDFHHIDSATKEKSVALILASSAIKLATEINRCTVLCAICHRRATYGHLDTANYQRCNITDDLIIPQTEGL